ncbi:MAG: hypothetical protein AABY22_26665 [Nanoarchaeota archaeon]
MSYYITQQEKNVLRERVLDSFKEKTGQILINKNWQHRPSICLGFKLRNIDDIKLISFTYYTYNILNNSKHEFDISIYSYKSLILWMEENLC